MLRLIVLAIHVDLIVRVASTPAVVLFARAHLKILKEFVFVVKGWASFMMVFSILVYNVSIHSTEQLLTFKIAKGVTRKVEISIVV
jgi:hypothetical protein